jgi:hypothetical protein
VKKAEEIEMTEANESAEDAVGGQESQAGGQEVPRADEAQQRGDEGELRAEEESAKAMEAEVPHPPGYTDPGQEQPS